MVWNLNGFLAEIGGGLVNSRSTGQLSENTLGKWVTEASGKRILQEGLAKHLSMCSNIRSVTCLRLDQVNLGLENPRSKKFQSSKHVLNSKALLRLIYLPLNLLFSHKISLKSPNSNQGRLCKSATYDRLDHKIFLSAI